MQENFKKNMKQNSKCKYLQKCLVTSWHSLANKLQSQAQKDTSLEILAARYSKNHDIVSKFFELISQLFTTASA